MTLTSDMAALDSDLLDDLGEDVLFNGTTVRAIFMTGPREVAGGQNVVEALLHECWCRKSDLPALAVDDPVIAQGTTYRFLRQDPPDETGFCRVELGTS